LGAERPRVRNFGFPQGFWQFLEVEEVDIFRI